MIPDHLKYKEPDKVPGTMVDMIKSGYYGVKGRDVCVEDDHRINSMRRSWGGSIAYVGEDSRYHWCDCGRCVGRELEYYRRMTNG